MNGSGVFKTWPWGPVLLGHLFGGRIRQVPEGPQAVLDQTLARVRQVEAQGLHASYDTHTPNTVNTVAPRVDLLLRH